MLFVGQPSAVTTISFSAHICLIFTLILSLFIYSTSLLQVASALSQITYQTTYNLITDMLLVEVFDGQRPSSGPGSGNHGDEIDSTFTCLEKEDFPSISRRGPGPFEAECFRPRVNVSIEVGKYAGSDLTVIDPDLSDNRQLGIAAAFFVLLVVFFVLRLLISCLCGWRLRGVPSDWDSDVEDDEDNKSDDTNSDTDEDSEEQFENEEEERLALRARKESRRQSLNAAATASASGGSGGGLLGAIRRLFGGGVNANTAVAIGMGGSGGGSGGDWRKSTMRKSIAAATRIGNGLEPLSSEAAVATREGAEQGGEAEYKFIPSDWRRHLDEDWHTYFSHPKVIYSCLGCCHTLQVNFCVMCHAPQFFIFIGISSLRADS
jgi:hypothetical protein